MDRADIVIVCRGGRRHRRQEYRELNRRDRKRSGGTSQQQTLKTFAHEDLRTAATESRNIRQSG
jgi:hypothetical protein